VNSVAKKVPKAHRTRRKRRGRESAHPSYDERASRTAPGERGAFGWGGREQGNEAPKVQLDPHGPAPDAVSGGVEVPTDPGQAGSPSKADGPRANADGTGGGFRGAPPRLRSKRVRL
jgi:hypothetical protein